MDAFLLGWILGPVILALVAVTIDEVDRWVHHPTNQWCSNCLYCLCHKENRRRVRQDRKEWEARYGRTIR